MTLHDLISLAAIKDGITIGGIIFVVISSLLQFSKININPWDKIFGWLGDKLNSKLKKEIDTIRKDVKEVKDSLNEHVKESEAKELQDTRRDILDFANACMNGRKHTKEQFDFVISECDTYENYIEKNNIKNGVVTSAIKEIKRLNDKCIQNNSFLKEREYD